MLLRSIAISLFLFIPLSLQSQPQKTVNIYTFPSTSYEIFASGKGYFPVLNRWENRLFAVIRAGGGHLGLGGSLELVRTAADGLRWDSPLTVVNSNLDDRNPAVGFSRTGRLIVGYQEQGSYDADGKFAENPWERARCMVTWSDDYGDTWSTPQPLGIAGLEPTSPYGRIIETTGGALLMSVYGPYTSNVHGGDDASERMNNYSYLVRSDDNGVTWTNPVMIGGGFNETALLQLKDGRLLAAMRTYGSQRVDVTLSQNDGQTWTPPLRVTGRMHHPADLIQLSNGWVLLVYGDRSAEERVIRGVISRDSCRTWDIDQGIVFSQPVRGDFGYPSIAALPDGKMALAHYHAGTAGGYDGSQARASITYFSEQELIDAYNRLVGN